jgi:hypothetical protein
LSNGRIENSGSPEERLAAVAVAVLRRFAGRAYGPDYADFRDAIAGAFRNQIARELIRARMAELDRLPESPIKQRRKIELMTDYSQIPVP